MKLLLDTHVLLWWFDDHPKISKKAYEVIENQENEVFVSVATSWEIAIKKAIGKLEAPDNIEEELTFHGFKILDIKITHAWATMNLPFHHKDPFDRLLVAQAQIERLTIVTQDSKIKKYDVLLIEA